MRFRFCFGRFSWGSNKMWVISCMHACTHARTHTHAAQHAHARLRTHARTLTRKKKSRFSRLHFLFSLAHERDITYLNSWTASAAVENGVRWYWPVSPMRPHLRREKKPPLNKRCHGDRRFLMRGNCTPIKWHLSKVTCLSVANMQEENQ